MPAMDNLSGSTVPAFLTKLLALVEDPKTDDLIRWSPNGTTFIVGDQGRFSKEVLPRYFKHNNIASFIRQLNMYGFRKMVGIESGGLKSDKDETEFFHPHFVQGQPEQLELIRRKVPTSKGDEVKVKHGDVTRVLTEVKQMKGKQESLDSRLDTMKRENEALWREVAELRQKHAKQQTIVNRLIQFLLSLVQTSRTGLKRRMPLMLSDVTEAPTSKTPKYERFLSIEPTTSNSYEVQSIIEEILRSSQEVHIQPTATSVSVNEEQYGPVISDVTDLNVDDDLNVVTAQLSPNAPTAETGVFSETPAGQENTTGGLDSATVGQESLQSILQKLSSPGAEGLQNILSQEVAPAAENTQLENLTEPVALLPESLLADDNDEGSPSTVAQDKQLEEDDMNKEESISVTETSKLKPPEKKEVKNLQVAVSQSPKIRYDLSEHCDSMQNNLDMLQSLLSADTYTFDPSSLVELFNPGTEEASLSSDSQCLLNTLTADYLASNLASTSTSTSGNIVGNEVTAYSGPARNILEDFAMPSLYDLTDESNPIFDSEEFEEKSSAKKSTS